jgi:hypothetical protein
VLYILTSCKVHDDKCLVEPPETLAGPTQLESLEKGRGRGGRVRVPCLQVVGNGAANAHLALPGAGAADVQAAVISGGLP